jgi:phage tail protein X
MINRYQNIPKTKIDGKTVYKTSRYPEVPLSENDIYVISTQGDRFDVLAQQYYNDSSLWWVISIANTGNAGAGTLPVLPQNSLIIPEGTQIRIPNNPIDVLDVFNKINS